MNDCFGQLDLKIEASHAEQPNVERQTDRKYVTSLSKLTPKMARFSEASSLTLMPSQQILVQIKELACECRRGLRGIGIGCRAFWACGVADMADVDSPKEQVDSSDVGLALLGFASGSMDALAFFNLGEVFPSAMTGNTALLGLALGQGHVIAASRPFIAFAGFLTGAAAASASVDLWLDKLPAPRAVCLLLALEACFLAAFALAWQFLDWPIAGVGLYGLIVIASSGMGIQSVAARLVGRSGITTVVFTSTLTSIVTAAIEALLRPPHRLPFATKRQIGMFLIYGVGAAICGLLASHGAAIALLPFVAVVGAAGFHWRAGQQDGSGT